MITRREFLRVSAAAAAGVALTACQAATQVPVEEKAEGGEKAVVEEKAGPERAKAWPMTDVPRNKTLIYYNNTPCAGNVNPFASGYTHQNGNAILLEPAAFYGVHADKNYMWLAESYSFNADATECTVNFRKGIKWSDGTAFTASDVSTSMERLKRVTCLNRGGTYVAELVKAEAVDDTTLKVTLNQLTGASSSRA